MRPKAIRLGILRTHGLLTVITASKPASQSTKTHSSISETTDGKMGFPLTHCLTPVITWTKSVSWGITKTRYHTI